MGDTHDDDEPTRWTSIGWQAALITNRLRCQAQLTDTDKQKNENRDREREPGDAHKDRVPEKLEDIERRVADILAMERRLIRKRI